MTQDKNCIMGGGIDNSWVRLGFTFGKSSQFFISFSLSCLTNTDNANGNIKEKNIFGDDVVPFKSYF